MSVKLVFQDDKGNAFYDKDIIYDESAPLPVPNELVILPDGQRITVISRHTAYVESRSGKSIDVQIIFVCQKEKKYTGGGVPLKGF